MTCDSKTVHDAVFVNDECVRVAWDYKDDFIQPHKTTNVVIAAFTTAQARLKLYEIMKPLGDRVLYTDTDSVIYKVKEGQSEPKLGSYLGDLTSETGCGDIECSGCEKEHYITEFLSGGPKIMDISVIMGTLQ